MEKRNIKTKGQFSSFNNVFTGHRINRNGSGSEVCRSDLGFVSVPLCERPRHLQAALILPTRPDSSHRHWCHQFRVSLPHLAFVLCLCGWIFWLVVNNFKIKSNYRLIRQRDVFYITQALKGSFSVVILGTEKLCSIIPWCRVVWVTQRSTVLILSTLKWCHFNTEVLYFGWANQTPKKLICWSLI